MATTIKWIDNNGIETAHRIYKSSTYFTKNNLPVPLVELGPDITEYVDSTGVDGENWYIVSALLNDYEVFSEPFIAGLSTAYIHDVFDDGSAVATYQFDGDATDLGGKYDGTWSGLETYSSGVIGQTAIFDGNSSIELPILSIITGNAARSYSLWHYSPSSSNTRQTLLQCGDNGVDNANFDIELNCYDGVSLVSTKYGIHVWGDASITSKDVIYDTWVHVVVVHLGGYISPSNTFIYINGESFSVNRTIAINTGNSSSFIGKRDYASSPLFLNGNIDQLRIFNRALTQQEIDILYQEGAAFL